MADIERVSVNEARRKVTVGEALLVCAYDDEEKWNKLKLGGAISLDSLRGRLPSLPKGQEIIFYCA